jgi:hypothetical protein
MTKAQHNAELREDASRIVADVENYSSSDRTRRGAEVKAAFPPVKSTAKRASKPAAKAMMSKSDVKKTTRAVAKPVAKSSTRPTAKPAAKTSSKGPTPAGISNWNHSGDVC